MTTDPAPQNEESTGDVPVPAIEERVAALEDVIDDLGAAIVEVAGGAPASATGNVGGSRDKDAAPPQPWGARASVEDWRELAAWVDWLSATYDVQLSSAVLPCWPAHGGAVHELAALHTAWVAAATVDASGNPGDAMNLWHERSLHPTLNRLRDNYQLRHCQDRHNAPRPARPTHTELIEMILGSADAPASPRDERLP